MGRGSHRSPQTSSTISAGESSHISSMLIVSVGCSHPTGAPLLRITSSIPALYNTCLTTHLCLSAFHLGCTTAVVLPECPVAIEYMQRVTDIHCAGVLGIVIHNFDTFLATHGLAATDGTLQNIIDHGYPNMIIERSAWVEAEQTNPRYPPMRQ